MLKYMAMVQALRCVLQGYPVPAGSCQRPLHGLGHWRNDAKTAHVPVSLRMSRPCGRQMLLLPAVVKTCQQQSSTLPSRCRKAFEEPCGSAVELERFQIGDNVGLARPHKCLPSGVTCSSQSSLQTQPSYSDSIPHSLLQSKLLLSMSFDVHTDEPLDQTLVLKWLRLHRSSTLPRQRHHTTSVFGHQFTAALGRGQVAGVHSRSLADLQPSQKDRWAHS